MVVRGCSGVGSKVSTNFTGRNSSLRRSEGVGCRDLYLSEREGSRLRWQLLSKQMRVMCPTNDRWRCIHSDYRLFYNLANAHCGELLSVVARDWMVFVHLSTFNLIHSMHAALSPILPPR